MPLQVAIVVFWVSFALLLTGLSAPSETVDAFVVGFSLLMATTFGLVAYSVANRFR